MEASIPQSFVCAHYHLVFSTKDRLPTITPSLQPRLYGYLGGLVRAQGGHLAAVGGMPDHVHLLTSVSKTQSISDALRTIKSNSSGWVHETFPDQAGFAWQTGYAAFAVSFSNMESVESYIANQAEHHRTTTFQQEYIASLDRHNIPYDERYLWD